MKMKDSRGQQTGDGGTYKYVRDLDEATSTAVTKSLTDVLDCDVDSLRPLTNVVDVDALNTLTESSDGNVHIEFEYADHLVTVRRGTEILVTTKD